MPNDINKPYCLIIVDRKISNVLFGEYKKNQSFCMVHEDDIVVLFGSLKIMQF